MNSFEKIRTEIKNRIRYYCDHLWEEEPYYIVVDEETGEPFLDENGCKITKTNEEYFELKGKKSEANVILRDIVNKHLPEDIDEFSDGYHTFNELYDYRMLYNAAFFNCLASHTYNWDVHKSKRHFDGEECFGGGWFIVMAELPTGQISNHYEMKYWDLFQVPEKEKANEWDGHTSQEAADRLKNYILKNERC